MSSNVPECFADGKEEGACSDKAAIDGLPTELLVMIFSYLSTEDLCYNASRVCLRWQEAMHFKSLWHNKELIYEPGHRSVFLFVLHVAPSLRKLVFNPLFCPDIEPIKKAILKGPKEIKVIEYNLQLFPYDVAARVLNHFKDHVCKLHLRGNVLKPINHKQNLSVLLGQMCHLESLKFSGYFKIKWEKNCLERGFTKLRHLDVAHVQDFSDAFVPLLESVKINLRTLKLPQVKSPVGVLGIISCCSELKELTVCLNDLTCIGGLHFLESLHILWSDGIPQSKLSQFIRNCSVLHKIKELTLHYIPGSFAITIAKQCHQLEVLSLHGITSCTDIIKSLPSLQKLCVVDRLSLRMRHVQKLPNYIPKLKHLNLKGCFEKQGIPPKIVSKLQKELPGLEILYDKFRSYSKHGNKGYFTKCNDSSTDCSSDEDS